MPVPEIPYQPRSRTNTSHVRGTDLDGHDRDATDERADREVDHGILGSVFGYDAVDHVRRKDGHAGEVEEET